MTVFATIALLLLLALYYWKVSPILSCFAIHPIIRHLARYYPGTGDTDRVLEREPDYIVRTKRWVREQMRDENSPAAQLATFTKENGSPIQEDGLAGGQLVLRDAIALELARTPNFLDQGHALIFRLFYPGHYFAFVFINVSRWIAIGLGAVLVYILLK